MGRVLVTGATGFVGADIVRALLAEGQDEVRAIVRPGSPRTGVLAGLPISQVSATLEDHVALARAVRGCDRIIHAAALLHVGTGHRARYVRINVEGTRALLEIAGELGVTRTVIVSSVAATALGSRAHPADESARFDLGKFRLPYIDTKRVQEEVALSFDRPGFEVVVVNPAFVFGPGDSKPITGQILVSFARELWPLVPPGGIPTVDVRDVAVGAVAALRRGRPGARYILSERNVSFLELGRLVARVRKCRPPLGVCPRAALVLAGLAADYAADVSGLDLPFSSAVALYASAFHATSGERARRELGLVYRPLEETVRDALAYFDATGISRRSLVDLVRASLG